MGKEPECRETPSVADAESPKAEGGARILEKQTNKALASVATHESSGSSSPQPEESEVCDALKSSLAMAKPRPGSAVDQTDAAPIPTA